MDENAKKNERELRKYRAKLRMDYYPLPLRWFKFFRYVSMILNIINCISGIGSYILLAAATNSPEAIEKIQSAACDSLCQDALMLWSIRRFIHSAILSEI